MGFNKAMLPDRIKVPVTFPHIYKDESGEPIKFIFSFRLETEGDGEALERLRATGAGVEAVNLERFCMLLTDVPEGFEDFPAEGGTVKTRAKAYFAGPEMAHFVTGALTLMGRVVNPAELFRGV